MKIMVALKNGEIIEVSKLKDQELLKGQTKPENIKLAKKFNGRLLTLKESFELMKTDKDFLEKIMKPFVIWNSDQLEKGISCKDKFRNEKWVEGAWLSDWKHEDLIASVRSYWYWYVARPRALAYDPLDRDVLGVSVFTTVGKPLKSSKADIQKAYEKGRRDERVSLLKHFRVLFKEMSKC